MKFSTISNIGKTREVNEDSYGNISIDNYDFFIVADGMGGHKDGEIASSVASKSFTDFIENTDISKYADIIKLQEDAISHANDKVYQISQQREEKVGTTAVCLCIDYPNHMIHISHIGDSRAYLYRHGDLLQITKDHSLVNELIDRGAIKEEEASNFINKSAITRAIGIGPVANPDNHSFESVNEDVVLLVTDGLSNELTVDEIIEIVKGSDDPYQISTNLIDQALDRGGRDNITVTTIKM